MSEHTKGPWFAATGWVGAGDVKTARVIVRCEGYPYGDTEANLKLIAAAPELLEVAKYALYEAYQSAHSSGDPDDESMMTSDAILYRMAKAAIAKAEGR